MVGITDHSFGSQFAVLVSEMSPKLVRGQKPNLFHYFLVQISCSVLQETAICVNHLIKLGDKFVPARFLRPGLHLLLMSEHQKIVNNQYS